MSLCRHYLKQHTVELKTVSKRVESKVRATLLRENSKLVMQEIYESPRNEEPIKASREEANGIVDAVIKTKNILYDLIEIENYDYYTYTHSVNVALLAIGLGINASLNDTKIIGSIPHHWPSALTIEDPFQSGDHNPNTTHRFSNTISEADTRPPLNIVYL